MAFLYYTPRDDTPRKVQETTNYDYKYRRTTQITRPDHSKQETGDRRRKTLVQARGPTSVASGWIEVGIELDGSWMELELGLGNGQGMKRPRGLPT